MNDIERMKLLRKLAEKYNDPKYFTKDPIIFPKHFAELYNEGKMKLQDVEIAAIIAAHLVWGRRDMIIRDCGRAMDEMQWAPYAYIMNGKYKDDDISLHRTVKWKDFAKICHNLKEYYLDNYSLESLSQDEMRVRIYGQKSAPDAANKKINMLRRWMVRDDHKVDLGLWKKIKKEDLIIPLDVHVHRSAVNLGITDRNSANYRTAKEITDYLSTVFPGDPLLGDFALFSASAEGDC